MIMDIPETTHHTIPHDSHRGHTHRCLTNKLDQGGVIGVERYADVEREVSLRRHMSE